MADTTNPTAAPAATQPEAISFALYVLRELLSEPDRNLEQRPARMVRVRQAVDALAEAQAAPAAHGTYSLDADPDGIRARTAAAITGALAFGAQGTSRPPKGHWLTPFWEAAQAEVAARARLAPAAQEAEPYPHEQMDALALARYRVVPHESIFGHHAVVAGDGTAHVFAGREVECANMARKFAGAFLDGAFAFHELTRTARPAAAAQEAEPTGCRISDPDGETSTKTALEIADDLMAEATMAANRANVSSDDYDISTTVRIAATTLRRQYSRIAELVAEPAASQAPAAALEQAWRAGWAACRDAEYVGEEAEDWAWGASATNGLAIDIEQSAPAAAVAPVAEEMLQALQLVASKLESRPYGTGSYIPKPIREKVHAAIARARQEGGGA